MKTKLLLSFTVLVALLMQFCTLDPSNLSDNRENIDKSWTAKISDSSVPDAYVIVISKDSSVTDKIYLSNFINNGSQAYATMSSLTLTVPQQTVGNSTVSGIGTISSDYQQINFDVTIDDASFTIEMHPGGVTKIQIAK